MVVIISLDSHYFFGGNDGSKSQGLLREGGGKRGNFTFSIGAQFFWVLYVVLGPNLHGQVKANSIILESTLVKEQISHLALPKERPSPASK